MLPELEALVDLQRCDAKILEARKQRDAIPGRRNALQSSLEAARAALDLARKELEQAKLVRRGHEKEIEVLQAEGVKLERQLLDVKTNKEYQAMLHEIEGLKAKRSDRETQILECFDREESLQARIRAAEASVSTEEGALRATEADLDRETAALDQTIHSLTQDRGLITPRLPGPLLARYDRLAQSRAGIAVAEIRKGACGACFKALTPQAVQEARRSDAVLSCEACGRLMVWTEASAT